MFEWRSSLNIFTLRDTAAWSKRRNPMPISQSEGMLVFAVIKDGYY